MGFLTKFLFFMLAVWLFMRLFGRSIATFAMRRLVRRLSKEAERQSEAYRQHYNQTPWERDIRVDERSTLKVPVSPSEAPARETHSLHKLAEDVEFEEIHDEGEAKK